MTPAAPQSRPSVPAAPDASEEVSPEILERIKTVLRRDLKLGPDARIADDMPLAGGSFDLDSLDMLLVLTSVEKEFGIRVQDGSMGRAAFASVKTLGRFIESACARK